MVVFVMNTLSNIDMKRSVFFLFFSLITCLYSFAAIDSEHVLTHLEALGFENLKCIQENHTTYLTAEDNVYRGNYRGIATLLQNISPDEGHHETDTILLVVLENKSPRMTIHAVHDMTGKWDISAEYGGNQKALQKLHSTDNNNSSLGKVDFVIHPQFMVDSLLHDNNHRFAFNIAPAIEITLWKGAKLTAQVIIPVWNNIETDKTYDRIRPGIMTISQQLNIGNRAELTATAGIFHTHQSLYADCRQGVDLDFLAHLTSKVDVGVQAGYTGKFYLDNAAWKFEKLEKLNLLGRISYYESSINSQFNLYFGQFVYGDKGVRIDATRRLAEYSIGCFGTYSNKNSGLGFYCSIPFGPKKKMKHNAVRISLPESLNWDYSIPNYAKEFTIERCGVTYSTTTYDLYSNNYWQQEYIVKYVKKFLNGEIR